MKQKTKMSLLFTFSSALITPIIIVNQININNYKQKMYQNSSKNLLNDNVDTSNLIQLNNNQNQLLKEISSKYDESKLLFESWKNEIKLFLDFQYNLEKFKESIIKQFPTGYHNGIPFLSNGYKQVSTFDMEKFREFLLKTRQNQVQNLAINPLNGFVHSSFSSNLSTEKISFLSHEEKKMTAPNYYQTFLKPVYESDLYFEPAKFFNSPYKYPNNLKLNFINKINNVPVNFYEINIDGYEKTKETS